MRRERNSSNKQEVEGGEKKTLSDQVMSPDVLLFGKSGLVVNISQTEHSLIIPPLVLHSVGRFFTSQTAFFFFFLLYWIYTQGAFHFCSTRFRQEMPSAARRVMLDVWLLWHVNGFGGSSLRCCRVLKQRGQNWCVKKTHKDEDWKVPSWGKIVFFFCLLFFFFKEENVFLAPVSLYM